MSKAGILENMARRKAILENPEHCIRVVYTPRHASWLNQVEIWFSVLTALPAAFDHYAPSISARSPKPTRDGDRIGISAVVIQRVEPLRSRRLAGAATPPGALINGPTTRRRAPDLLAARRSPARQHIRSRALRSRHHRRVLPLPDVNPGDEDLVLGGELLHHRPRNGVLPAQ